MAASADTSKPYIPLAGVATDGWSADTEATATCYCGAVQLAFPTVSPGLLTIAVCHCPDCRKITASMFSSIIVVADTHLKHVRGRENLKEYAQSKTTATGLRMSNHFCTTCGSLMYRLSEKTPGSFLLRVGTVDDFSLHETKLRPRAEIYTKDRVSWCKAIEGVVQFEGNPSAAEVGAVV